ncbi:MAG TPA: 2-C-methyl-D-erythritol 2,4-cyclodiphosphate synthase [Candidatus Kapabacteria bacterium]|jgi:2-C-methyl-D-erythritol 2,4-cyclodiphosphate synthase|nr:2-C-methyl-D-erythritol 2,4-cyclodiphosphate synthase [Candidatus Kapabacteria bacterium]
MIGFGYDVHKLAEGESLVLGGVVLESRLGTVAHSDGDVLIHAIMDAMLGALALGDIGLHFPDTKEEWRGADSIAMLKRVSHILRSEETHVVNIDSTVVLEAPRLRPHIEAMRERIAKALSLDVKRVSIKATTNERLGFIGREEGVAAYAVVQVEWD